LLLHASSASALTTVSVKGVDTGDYYSGTAECPKGKHVVSGGFTTPERGFALTNRAVSDREWTVVADSDSLTVFAYCSAKINVAAETKDIAIDPKSGAQHTATARCGRGRTALAGGWDFEDQVANTPVFKSRRVSERAWSVTAFNGGNEEMTAIVYCANVGDTAIRSKRSARVPPEGDGRVTARCHKGEELLGGGFSTSPKSDYSNTTGPDFFYAASRRRGKRGWATAVHNYSDRGGRIKASAICAT
jgi:hypothetical protein